MHLFVKLLNGVQMDLYKSRYATFAELCTISHYRLYFWAAASAQRALAAAVRARLSPLHIKKALASKWY